MRRGVQLRSLEGETVVFTGFLSILRREAEQLVAEAGGRTSSKVTASTTVVVQGAPSALWSIRSRSGESIGLKLAAVDEVRAAGHRIYLVNEDEFRGLVSGAPLTRSASMAALGGVSDEFGVPLRPRRPQDRTDGDRWRIVDLDALDRGSREHERCVQRIGEALRREGVQPLEGPTGARYDVGWRVGRSFYVGEVKTLQSPTTERQQLRLGLGQVLEYRAFLARSAPRGVRALLIVDREPAGDFTGVCDQVGVELFTVDGLEARVKATGGDLRRRGRSGR